ncbi:MAG: HIT family protein [Agathobacter sp.]|nr:HIT family protein [Agathobacter sp.]MBQ6812995.1 HIT family protein [Agathobacter sp.]
MKQDNCIFCKIANGEIPTNTIFEDEDFRVFMDVAPATKGHALVVPKNHYADIYEIEPEVLAKAAKVAQKVIKHATKVLGCEGYNLMQNNGEVSGQTVFHFHLHMIPRYENMDNTNLLSWTPGTSTSEELKELSESLKVQ